MGPRHLLSLPISSSPWPGLVPSELAYSGHEVLGQMAAWRGFAALTVFPIHFLLSASLLFSLANSLLQLTLQKTCFRKKSGFEYNFVVRNNKTGSVDKESQQGGLSPIVL